MKGWILIFKPLRTVGCLNTLLCKVAAAYKNNLRLSSQQRVRQSEHTNMANPTHAQHIMSAFEVVHPYVLITGRNLHNVLNTDLPLFVETSILQEQSHRNTAGKGSRGFALMLLQNESQFTQLFCGTVRLGCIPSSVSHWPLFTPWSIIIALI